MSHPLGSYKARVSSRFGERIHPITKAKQMHHGVDFAAAEGTPVVSPWDGEVLSIQSDELNGNYVRLRHGTDVVTCYCHLEHFAALMAVGDRVSAGEIIGYVGTTGRSTGPHLHFGCMVRGNWVDPLLVLAVENIYSI